MRPPNFWRLTQLPTRGVLSCQFGVIEDIVTLRYKTGDLDWEVNRVQDEVELCEATEFEIKVVSAKFANVYDVAVSVDLPEGVSVTDIAQWSYTYDGAPYTQVPAGFILQNISDIEDVKIDASGLVTSLLVASVILLMLQKVRYQGFD
ncbi:hypothetical protein N7U66_03400 [Lacinutrix neustonica]|uniref:Uncharacterized protein n=1 Tax=Lacinutrix neustonica TaxID=2980107 RepID=A0A9E8MYS4_9FLAO|nr:hypothetical protein [Lacinutrix neustonica]WAC02730.1 hypothetical protein N7U66_03400 [Lacinutrix neustonica]